MVPLRDLVRLCSHDDLYSYIPLIPVICGFVIWLDRKLLPQDYDRSVQLAMVPAAGGIAVLGLYGVARQGGWQPEIFDYLAVMMTSLYLFIIAGCFISLGKTFVKTIAFSTVYLAFAIPMPSGMRDWIESFLQHKSADVADLIFSISGMPVFRQELVFQLPGFTFQVAPECSGIHSTWVLFVLSVLAAYLFLRSTWRRAALIACVLPLALVRNGFRIWVIGELCVHVSPDMINSYIHRHGGPIFFVLSLFPLGLFLAFLQKTEARKKSPSAVNRVVTTESPP